MHKVELLAIPDHKNNGMAVCLKPKVPHCITPSLALEIRRLQDIIAENYYKKPWEEVYYVLWYLHTNNFPWTGLDFNYIYDELHQHHEKKVEEYLQTIFELLFANYVGFNLPLVNCSLVHCKLSGISQDFFYLNQVNFIKRYKEIHCIKCNHAPFHQLDFPEEIKEASFPGNIYKRSNFYIFDTINLNSMKKVLCAHQYAPIPLTQQKQLKLIFNHIMQKTLEKIYKLISNETS